MSYQPDHERAARRRDDMARMRQQLADLAMKIANTADSMADTLDRVACNQPADGDRLRERAAAARQYAALERERAAYFRTSPHGHDLRS